MRYKVEFEFDTDHKVNGIPSAWVWSNLLEDIEDDYTTIDWNTLGVYRQNWELIEDD